jgi:hypothetical protein
VDPLDLEIIDVEVLVCVDRILDPEIIPELDFELPEECLLELDDEASLTLEECEVRVVIGLAANATFATSNWLIRNKNKIPKRREPFEINAKLPMANFVVNKKKSEFREQKTLEAGTLRVPSDF